MVGHGDILADLASSEWDIPTSNMAGQASVPVPRRGQRQLTASHPVGIGGLEGSYSGLELQVVLWSVFIYILYYRQPLYTLLLLLVSPPPPFCTITD